MSLFLVDASLPRATGDVIRAYGHQATDVRDIGLGTASDQDIADHARQHQLALVTGDRDFGNVLAFPPADYFGLVIIRPPDGATTAVLLSLVEQFLNDSKVMVNLPGHLVIVEPGRIRCRPPIRFQDADDLPEPEELATDAIAELEGTVEELNQVLVLLENRGGCTINLHEPYERVGYGTRRPHRERRCRL
jgi:predicted nuclease of predicted toxin-antitoxin system